MLLADRYVDGALPDTGWVLGPLLMSLGALHPSVRESGTDRVADDRLYWWSAVLLGAAPAIGPFLIAFTDGADPDHHLGAVVLILVGSVAMATLALTRLGLLVRDARRLSADLEVAVGERDVLLVASQHRYQTLIEQLPGVMYIIMPGDGDGDGDADGASVLYLSPQVEEIMGVTVEECLLDIDALARGIHPEDLLVLADTIALGALGQRRIEYRYHRPDGEWIWIRDEGSLVAGPSGEPMMQGILFDISAEKRAESRARATGARPAPGAEARGGRPARGRHRARDQHADPVRRRHDPASSSEAFERRARAESPSTRRRCAVVAGEPVDAELAARIARGRGERRPRVPARACAGRRSPAPPTGSTGSRRSSARCASSRHPPTTEMGPVDLNAAIERTLDGGRQRVQVRRRRRDGPRRRCRRYVQRRRDQPGDPEPDRQRRPRDRGRRRRRERARRASASRSRRDLLLTDGRDVGHEAAVTALAGEVHDDDPARLQARHDAVAELGVDDLVADAGTAAASLVSSPAYSADAAAACDHDATRPGVGKPREMRDGWSVSSRGISSRKRDLIVGPTRRRSPSGAARR